MSETPQYTELKIKRIKGVVLGLEYYEKGYNLKC